MSANKLEQFLKLCVTEFALLHFSISDKAGLHYDTLSIDVSI